MSIRNIFYIILGLYVGIFVILQIYFAYRLHKSKQQTGLDQPAAADTEMSAKATFRFSMFLITFQIFLLIFTLYFTLTGSWPWYLGIIIIIGILIYVRKPIRWAQKSRSISPGVSVALPLRHTRESVLTPENILEILSQECVILAIKKDLSKTHQIARKETWCLALITPDQDKYDLSLSQLSRQERLRSFSDSNARLNFDNQIPVKRVAVVHSAPYFNRHWNNVQVFHGATERMIRQYPGWNYSLAPTIPDEKWANIRDLKISSSSASLHNRNPIFTKFLQEDGFTLKDSYLDGDPLTTERGGTIVIDKGKLKIIYPEYFIQTRLIDDTGNLIYLGLDENFQHKNSWLGVSFVPSTSKKLFQCVDNNEYIPVLRYRSFPYKSDFMLPILDTPMSASGWADLFIDPSGKGKLFIAKEKALDEWIEMMNRLKELFFVELTKKGYHLLALTKDLRHLNEYLSKKQAILEDYFIIRDWTLP